VSTKAFTLVLTRGVYKNRFRLPEQCYYELDADDNDKIRDVTKLVEIRIRQMWRILTFKIR